MRYTGVVVAALSLVGCSSAPAPMVAVTGSAEDRAALVGVWDGQYSSTETGRAGVIVFEFSANADSAVGEAVIVPQEQIPRAFRLEAGEHPIEEYSNYSQVVAIQRLHVEGGELHGQMEPYQDPACQCVACVCMVNTEFRGKVEGGRIAGTFTIHHPDGVTQTGQWVVTRHGSPGHVHN